MAATYKWNFDSNTKKSDPKTMGWLYSRYVLGCPVPKVSARGRTFEALGWKGSAFLTLNAQLKKQSDLTNSRWAWLRDDKNEFLERIRSEGIDRSYSLEHEFAYYAKGGKPKIEGLFYMIRNGLAHGSFRYHSVKGVEYLALETRNNGKLRGRAVLKIETLKKWRLLLDNSKKYLK